MNDHRVRGGTEIVVLRHLALHPNVLIQPTAKALMKDYKNVHNVFTSLKKKGYIEESKKVETTMGGEYSSYRLTVKGVAWVLAKCEDMELMKVIEEYEGDLPRFELAKGILVQLSPKTAKKVLNWVGENYHNYGDKIFSNSSLFLLSMTSGFHKFHERERRELKRLVKNPAVREGIIETRDRLNRLLESYQEE